MYLRLIWRCRLKGWKGGGGRREGRGEAVVGRDEYVGSTKRLRRESFTRGASARCTHGKAQSNEKSSSFHPVNTKKWMIMLWIDTLHQRSWGEGGGSGERGLGL